MSVTRDTSHVPTSPQDFPPQSTVFEHPAPDGLLAMHAFTAFCSVALSGNWYLGGGLGGGGLGGGETVERANRNAFLMVVGVVRGEETVERAQSAVESPWWSHTQAGHRGRWLEFVPAPRTPIWQRRQPGAVGPTQPLGFLGFRADVRNEKEILYEYGG
jgi:hypothetical protein